MSTTPTAQSPLRALGGAMENVEALDAAGKAIGKQVRSALGPGPLKDLLSGTWLGHALHPILTDVVIGSFTSATILDLVGGRESAPAARKLVGVGLLSYGPTALTGVNDWADSEATSAGVRRVGLIHAASNAAAATLYTLSWRARGKGLRGRGVLYGLAGAGALTAGGFLGGHLSYAQGVGVNQTVFDEGPSEWTPALEGSQLPEGQARTAVVGDTPVVLVRQNGQVSALHDRCSHRGCSLSGKGTVTDGAIECGCHGSRYDLSDGGVLRGPATTAQPAYEVREQGDRIEIKLPS
jgi:nitrite reductase/ring-hydroxylating ferredoxin subunit